mmetsp:Transcript_33036/g.98182  ORF Transcript_33036/g.98182 Transcript_33036/m.98182 type:complete len:749 (+) Transcript_33036:71-2317(+)
MTATNMAVDLKNLPNLPGFSFPEYKDRYARPNSFSVVNGVVMETKAGVSHEKPKFVKTAKPVETWRSGSLPDSTSRHVMKKEQITHMMLPAWDALDRHVLRFYGYFKEAVVETNLENYRVRNVTIYYYLEDDTMQVTEPKQDNSGIPQGQLIRRHRFPKPDGGYMTYEDLMVGGELAVYGRHIAITDCDGFTRQHYEEAGMEQGVALEAETDPFQQTRQVLKVVEAKAPRTYEKIYREVMLGGGHINADMQQFLEKDRKVLRFFCIMDDIKTPLFERRPFQICYYLADDTVEVRELYPLNCGRDNFPIFFKRGRMPLGTYTLQGPQAQPKQKHEFFQATDFAVGIDVNMLGNNNFFIYDADAFTREYFMEEFGVQLDPKTDVSLPERAVPRAQTPPYTGYGSWEDSLGSVTHLVPKVPKKDFQKLFQHSGKILRFKARFANPKPEDVDRIFVISFYLEDDCVQIHEPPQRNLGIVTGRFLEKAIYVNQDTGNLFEPTDFLPGKQVSVYNHCFEMLDSDEYTQKLFANPDAKLRTFDIQAVIMKIREGMRAQFPLVRDVFRRFDTDHDGVMTLGEFKTVVGKFGFMLDDDEVLAIMKHFDKRGDGQVSYNEFCDELLEEDHNPRMIQAKRPIDPEFDAEYADKAAFKAAERAETAQVRTAVKVLGDILAKRQNMITKVIKEFNHLTHESVVSLEQIQWALKQTGHAMDLQDINRAVLFVLGPETDVNRIEYVKLFKAVTATFHDMSANR